MALGNLLKRALAPASLGGLLCALLIAACGSQPAAKALVTRTTETAAQANNTVWIYSSLPYGGPEAPESLEIQRGIDLGLSQARHEARGTQGVVFRVRYRALNDSRLVRHRRRGGPASGSTSDRSKSAVSTTVTNSYGWNVNATVAAAARAARNPQTVAYIGDLDSGATKLSLPILNQAGVLQITPGSGYPGLTDAYKGLTQPTGEPGKYYPQSQRTLLRLIPSDIVQASAVLDVLHGAGCRKVAAWQFGTTVEDAALLGAVAQTAPMYGMQYFSPPSLKGVKSYVTYAYDLRSQDLHCAVLVGHVTKAAAALTVELHEQLTLTIAGTAGFCSPAWPRAIVASGVAKSIAKAVVAGLSCTTPALPVTKYAGHRSFIPLFRRAYHRKPDAWAYYGYRAAEMVLRALTGIGKGQDNRQLLLNNLLYDYVPDATAPFTFDGHGNITSNGTGSGVYAGYGVDVFTGGVPTWHRTVTPTHLLLSDG